MKNADTPDERMTLRRRAQLLDATNQSARLTTIGKPIPVLHQQDTDYAPMPNLAAMPLKLRERSRHTNWPVPQRADVISALPEERNVGKLFRRYANGTLCYDDVVPKLKRIVHRFNQAVAPLNETDAIMLMAVFPEVKFRYLTPEIVELKAPLSERERTLIRRRLPICPTAVR